ncbi:ATP synthase subunit b [Bienertia sinuspersici]
MSNSTTIETSSPLYVHPSDGSDLITVEKLQGSLKYRVWKISMELALTTKRKLGIVTGGVSRDKSDIVKQEAWGTCNGLVISWILRNVNDSIKRSIIFMNFAKFIWKNLEKRFQVNNGARRYQINKMLYETKQNGKLVNEYFTDMQVLWEELENLTNYPPLTEMNAELAEYVSFRHQQHEEHKLFQFLNGLDEVNAAIRTQLLMQIVLPIVEQACNTVSQEESQRKIMKQVNEEMDSVVMFSKGVVNSCGICGKV